MAEIAIVSSRKSRLENSAQKGNKGAEAALELANAPNTFLSTVQIGITLIGILTGFFSGAGLSQQMARYIARIPVLEQYSQGIAVFVMVLLITFVSLVLGELVPKRIGMHNPEAIASVMARPMNVVSRITAPLVWLLSVSTDGLLRLLRLKPSEEPAVTEEEVTSLIAQGTNLGVFEEVEQDIVERVFALSDRRVGSIMTNKLDVEWIDINDEFDNIKQTIQQLSRLPRFARRRDRHHQHQEVSPDAPPERTGGLARDGRKGAIHPRKHESLPGARTIQGQQDPHCRGGR
jgi:putative hemolysin